MGLDASDTQLTALSKDYLVYRALAAPAVLFITVGQGTLRGVKVRRARGCENLGAKILKTLFLVANSLFFMAGRTAYAQNSKRVLFTK